MNDKMLKMSSVDISETSNVSNCRKQYRRCLVSLHSVWTSAYICGLPYFLVEATPAEELNRFFLHPAGAIPVCHLTDHSRTLRR
jgi:hypothetical protein